ncbi:MBL fold metallo-hydrolase [Aquibacillus salsiterrae]|uniref:MBL fold metallo-hydrolase n=1 Tax=Aquibacillus salsiterrae TaxID=2950439 RepID=A0A9X3WCP7_9BACI|nr:MBL fold metallo-hydrolase [Aquibacillus salsiterrae]MDC3416223.1 MBL fold metallo-hydrolase [Aquibacillus salsiterrae]
MDHDMNYGEDYKFIPATSVGSGVSAKVLPDVICHTIQIVNIVFIGNPKTNEFVLIDAGMTHAADEIISVTEKYYGRNSRPKAIILTHGHFDHVGSIIELIDHWNVPVYAHKFEIPFLTGELRYPKPDGSVEGGLVAKLSPLFPNEPINIGTHVEKLPADGTVPYLPEFKWIHTPGHSPGHISLFRDSDRTLIAGDAFVTVKQDSLYKVFTQEKEINGPPRYLTTDWKSAWDSVEKLAKLKPILAVTGHGLPMSGEELTRSLDRLVQLFDQLAIPDYGKYVNKKH